MASLNKYTYNLTKSLSIDEYPTYKGKVMTDKLQSVKSSVTFNNDLKTHVEFDKKCESLIEKQALLKVQFDFLLKTLNQNNENKMDESLDQIDSTQNNDKHPVDPLLKKDLDETLL